MIEVKPISNYLNIRNGTVLLELKLTKQILSPLGQIEYHCKKQIEVMLVRNRDTFGKIVWTQWRSLHGQIFAHNVFFHTCESLPWIYNIFYYKTEFDEICSHLFINSNLLIECRELCSFILFNAISRCMWRLATRCLSPKSKQLTI